MERHEVPPSFRMMPDRRFSDSNIACGVPLEAPPPILEINCRLMRQEDPVVDDDSVLSLNTSNHSSRGLYSAPGAVERRRFAAPMPHDYPHQQEVVQNHGNVDFVHHDSPCGPAISIYPRSRSTGSNNPRPSSNSRGFASLAAPRAAQQGGRRAGLTRGSSYTDRHRRGARPTGKAPQRRSFHAPSPMAAAVAAAPSLLSTPPPRPAASNHGGTPVVEVSPGVHVPLRGSAETREYVRQDMIAPALCFSCDTEVFCVKDAQFMLCPRCRSVNPMEGSLENGGGGLGLGITLEMLGSIQQELIAQETQQERQRQHQQQRAAVASRASRRIEI